MDSSSQPANVASSEEAREVVIESCFGTRFQSEALLLASRVQEDMGLRTFVALYEESWAALAICEIIHTLVAAALFHIAILASHGHGRMAVFAWCFLAVPTTTWVNRRVDRCIRPRERAFEIWHKGQLVYSGVRTGLTPKPEDVMDMLERRGVAKREGGPLREALLERVICKARLQARVEAVTQACEDMLSESHAALHEAFQVELHACTCGAFEGAADKAFQATIVKAARMLTCIPKEGVELLFDYQQFRADVLSAFDVSVASFEESERHALKVAMEKSVGATSAKDIVRFVMSV